MFPTEEVIATTPDGQEIVHVALREGTMCSDFWCVGGHALEVNLRRVGVSIQF